MARGLPTTEKPSLAMLEAWLASAALVHENAWRIYGDARFSIACEYPVLFRNRDSAPDNGDVQAFRTTDGDAILRVFGFLNVEHASSAAMLAERTRGKGRLPYRMARNDRFAFSGTQEDADVYLRCNLGSDDVVGCVVITYLTRDRGVWIPLVTRVSGSLRVK